jgi:putative ABC transport system permease protein
MRAKVVMPLAASQKVFARGRNIDAVDIVAEEEIAESTKALDRLKATLQEELGPAYDVVYPAARAKGVAEALRGMSMGLSYFAVTSLFVGAYLVFNTFSMTVAERTREIGMLRAIGTTKWQNFRLLLTEAIIMGLFGSLLGFLVGFLISIPMMKIMGGTFGIEARLLSIPIGGLITGFIVGVALTAVSALIPAFRAGRISPVEAIAARGRERKAGWFVRHGWKVGLALVIISQLIPGIPMRELPEEAEMGISQMSFLLFMVGLTLLVPLLTVLLERLTRPLMSLIYGNEGRIGSGNVHRVKGRTSLTVGALTVGVLMFIIFGVMKASMTYDVRRWMDAALRGDLFVSSFRPMRVEFGRELASVEGVSMVTPMHIMSAKIVGTTTAEGFTPRDDTVAFIAVEPSGYTQISEFKFASGQGDEREMLERFEEGDAVFVATQVSEMYGIKKGDLFRLRTRRGEVDFVVAGVIIDYTWGGWSIHGSWEDLKRYFATNKAHFFMVDVAPEASVDDVQKRIEEKYGKARHVEVESGREYREKWLKKFMQWGAFFDVVVMIGILIAAFGIANTLMMNVLERIREIGSLRAVGMTRPQVMRMILAEALIIGILGGILGVIFGAYSSYFALQGMEEGTGWEVTFMLPTSVLLTGIAIAIGVSQVAALYPAWRAASVNIVRAVRYE